MGLLNFSNLNASFTSEGTLSLECSVGNRPRQEVDHGSIVFHCRPCLNMLGDSVTVTCDHDVTMVHSQPWL